MKLTKLRTRSRDQEKPSTESLLSSSETVSGIRNPALSASSVTQDMSHREKREFTRRSSEDRVGERSWTPVRANSTASDLVTYDHVKPQQSLQKTDADLASTSTLQDEEEHRVNQLLAQLNSAMKIEPEPSTSSDFSSGMLDNLSLASELEYSITGTKKKKGKETPSEMSSTTTLHEDLERSTLRLDSPGSDHQASTSQDVSSRVLDTRSPAHVKQEQPIQLKKKKVKKMSKSEMQKMKAEMDMWNASDSTVLEHLLNNKGPVSKWQAVATARGLCSLSNSCRCHDCQASYVTFDNDGDGGMTEMSLAPACVLQ